MLSHTGSYVIDYMLTEYFSRSGHDSKHYRVVYNPTYTMMWEESPNAPNKMRSGISHCVYSVEYPADPLPFLGADVLNESPFCLD